jgi:predicted enzyme related to lactoylglutathione lyase
MAGNKVVHIEVPAGETTRAREFWSGLVGWSFQTFEGPMEYHTFEGEPGGGLYPAEGGDKGIRLYFPTDDIKAEVARVNELGGEGGEPGPVPGMGWYSICKDTEGNEFGLWQNDPSAQAPSE